MPDTSDSRMDVMPVAGSELDVTTLEHIAAKGWQGTTVAPLGDWLLRAGHGFTGRANSVLPLGSSGAEPDGALEIVREFYRGVDLPAVIQMPEDRPGSALAELDQQLQRRGWRPYNGTAVMTASVVEVAQMCPRSEALPPSAFDSQPTAAWLSGYHYRGRPLPSTAVAVLTNALSPVFVTVPGTGASGATGDVTRASGATGDVTRASGATGDVTRASGATRGVARGVITHGWLGVTAVTVDHAHRRQGVGRHLMGELTRWAAAAPEPAHSIYLQVDRANEVALAMYRRLGFAQHHAYHYLADPESRS